MTACARPLAITACARSFADSASAGLLAIIDQVKVIEPRKERHIKLSLAHVIDRF
jgi:hypothetical protein